jgi:hypothetical protein
MTYSKKRTLKTSLTNFAASHSRLLTMGIYAGVALAISAAMGFVLYPEQQASAKAFVFYPE